LSPVSVASVASGYGGNDPDIIAALDIAVKTNKYAREIDDFIQRNRTPVAPTPSPLTDRRHLTDSLTVVTRSPSTR
jgi:hypothetical protein